MLPTTATASARSHYGGVALRRGQGKGIVRCVRPCVVYLLQIDPAQKLDQGLAEDEKDSETNEGPRQCADIVDDGLGPAIAGLSSSRGDRI